MGYSSVAILRDLNGDPIPQYYDTIAGEFKPLTELVVYGAGDGNRPASGEYVGQVYQSVETGNAWRWSGTAWEDYSIPASAARQDAAKTVLDDIQTAVEGDVQTALDALVAKDFATQTTLAALLAKVIAAPATEAKQDTLIAKDFATQTTLAALLAKMIAAPATEAKQDTLIAKDYATQTTLAALLAKVIAAPATEAKQDTGNTALGHIKTATETLKTDSIAEHMWVDGDAEPTPTATRAIGLVFDPGTDDVVVKIWTGAAWEVM
jgi:hypothetical protein